MEGIITATTEAESVENEIVTIEEGTQVKILTTDDGGWWRVQTFEGTEFFVPSHTVQIIEATNTKTEEIQSSPENTSRPLPSLPPTQRGGARGGRAGGAQNSNPRSQSVGNRGTPRGGRGLQRGTSYGTLPPRGERSTTSAIPAVISPSPTGRQLPPPPVAAGVGATQTSATESTTAVPAVNNINPTSPRGNNISPLSTNSHSNSNINTSSNTGPPTIPLNNTVINSTPNNHNSNAPNSPTVAAGPAPQQPRSLPNPLAMSSPTPVRHNLPPIPPPPVITSSGGGGGVVVAAPNVTTNIHTPSITKEPQEVVTISSNVQNNNIPPVGRAGGPGRPRGGGTDRGAPRGMPRGSPRGTPERGGMNERGGHGGERGGMIERGGFGGDMRGGMNERGGHVSERGGMIERGGEIRGGGVGVRGSPRVPRAGHPGPGPNQPIQNSNNSNNIVSKSPPNSNSSADEFLHRRNAFASTTLTNTLRSKAEEEGLATSFSNSSPLITESDDEDERNTSFDSDHVDCNISSNYNKRSSEEGNASSIHDNTSGAPSTESTTQDLSPEDRLKLEQHRRKVVDEIITTEKDYISDLEIVVKVFITPLTEKNLLTREDTQTLFSNVSVILSVNKEVARLFETRSDEEKDGPLLVGDIFLKMADFFKMYTTYCANQPKALSALDRLSKTPAFSEFLSESLLNPETRGLTLFSFLIKPIQRICKYPLLLKDLLKHTEPEHPDYDNLSNALTKINEVVEYVNERKRLAENLQKILEIQNQIETSEDLGLVEPTRRFVREMMIFVYEKGKKRSRKMFVFNDLILLTKQKLSVKTMVGGSARDHFSCKFYLKDVKIVEMADSDEVIDAVEVRPKDEKEKARILIFNDLTEKRSWLKEIKTLVREFQKREVQAVKQAKLKAEEQAHDDLAISSAPSLLSSSSASSATIKSSMSMNSISSSADDDHHRMNGTSDHHHHRNNNNSNSSNNIMRGGNQRPIPPGGQNVMGVPPPMLKKSASTSLFSKKPNKDKSAKKSSTPLVPSKANTQKYKKELVKTLKKKD